MSEPLGILEALGVSGALEISEPLPFEALREAFVAIVLLSRGDGIEEVVVAE
jgi:hypothetical protein